MKKSVKHIILTASLAFAAIFPAVAQTARRPALAVIITVEGLSGEYLRLLYNQLHPGGFPRLMENGMSLRRLDYGPNVDAAASTAILLTGAAPTVNGIPAAKVYDVTTKLPRPILNDPSTIGNFTDETFSPAPLKVSTVADELRIDTDGAGHAYAVAPYSHQAIIGAGHAGNGGFWINDMTANWASSAYYKEMPSAIRERNYRNGLAQRMDTMKWVPMTDLSLYPGVPEQQRTHPFRNLFPRKDIQRVRRFLASPLANDEITDVAIDLIKETALGKDNETDMIMVGYTVATAGSRSEIIDSYLRLDRDLSRLLAAVDQAAGTGKAIVLLAGLPSTTGSASDDKRWNIPSGLYSVKRANSLLDIQLMAVHGNGDWILGYHDRHFFLNRQLIKDRGLSLQDFRREVADFLARMAGISNVVTIDDIMASRAGDNPEATRRNTSIAHAGDVIIEVSPGWQIVDDGSGRASGVQRHTATDIPAFLTGPGVDRTDIDATVDARTLAPTLSRLLQMRAPNGASLPALNLNKPSKQ